MVDFLLVSEVAARLRRTPQFVTRLARQADIPAYRIGRGWRIDAAQFEVWLQRQQPRKWQPSISGARPGGIATSGMAKRSGDLVAQALKRMHKRHSQTPSEKNGE